VVAEDFAGVEVDDGDGGVIDEGQDTLASVLGADAEVVHFAGVAEGHFAAGIDVVVADAVVLAGGCRGLGFGVGVVRVVWGVTVIRAVRALGTAEGSVDS